MRVPREILDHGAEVDPLLDEPPIFGDLPFIHHFPPEVFVEPIGSPVLVARDLAVNAGHPAPAQHLQHVDDEIGDDPDPTMLGQRVEMHVRRTRRGVGRLAPSAP